MTECAAKYLLACTDPWNPKAAGACVPTTPALRSQKQRRYYRTTLAIGTGGVGFIAVDPNVSNNEASIWYSTPTFAGTTIPNAAVGSGPPVGVSEAALNSGGYSSAQLGNGVSSVMGRLVSVSVAVQDVSPQLNRGGVIYGLTQPEHEGIDGYSVSQLAAYQESYVQPNDGRKHWIAAYGIDPNELAYPNTLSIGTEYTSPFSRKCDQYYAAGTTRPIMGFLLSGLPGNTYMVEIVQHVEYIGQLSVPMQSRTDSDPEGLGKAQEALANTSAIANAHPEKSLLQCAGEAIKFVTQHAPVVVDFIKFASGGPSAPLVNRSLRLLGG